MKAVAVVLTLALVLAGCGGSESPAGARPITVFAASSLTETFTELARRSDSKITFSFDASSTLVQQVKAGAPADVLATADELTMQQAVDAGAVGSPSVFAHNRLAIVVTKGNPKGIRSLPDLARPDVVLVLCGAEAPCGRFAAQALERARVAATPRSFEPNVKGVVSKVTLGEADAGIVYATDVKAAGERTEGVPIPAEHNVLTAASVAVVRSAPNPEGAAAFVALLRSSESRRVLADAGFDNGR